MKCSNCGRLTEGGYCDCMIVDGEFKGAHWRKDDEGEDDNMNIHVIKDESLGGVEREYIKNYEDIIANLVRRVSELEQQTTELEKDNERQAFKIDDLEQHCGGLKDDIETWAQEVEGLRNDLAGYRDDYLAIGSAVEELDDKIEMCIDDIVTLDERTQPKEITISTETLAKLIGGAR